MKNELNKKIKEICDSVGTPAAKQMAEDLTENLDRQFDRRVAAGMSELDAFRDVLRNVDQIEQMLKDLPSDEGNEIAEKAERPKKLEFYLSKISAVMWLGTTLLFLALGMGLHLWKTAWLVFIWSAIGEILLDMTKNINRGKNEKKVIREGLSGILWLSTTILFFLLGFYGHLWSTAWLVFIAAAIVQILLGTFLND